MPIMSLIQKRNNKKTYHQPDNIAISYKRKPLQFEGAAFKIKKMDTSGCSQEEKDPCSLFSYHTGQKKKNTLQSFPFFQLSVKNKEKKSKTQLFFKAE